jgi:hypothetical protein
LSARPSYSFFIKPLAGEAEMDRAPKQGLAQGEPEALTRLEPHAELADETRRRQKAAALLRAARQTDSAEEREALRRKAGELLSSRRRGRQAY